MVEEMMPRHRGSTVFCHDMKPRFFRRTNGCITADEEEHGISKWHNAIENDNDQIQNRVNSSTNQNKLKVTL
jgi:hypothetical protein